MINRLEKKSVLVDAVRQFCMESQLEQGQGKVRYILRLEPSKAAPEVSSSSERTPVEVAQAPAPHAEARDRSPQHHPSKDSKDRSRSELIPCDLSFIATLALISVLLLRNGSGTTLMIWC